jgi:GGDEF domain-containing protein
VKIHVAASIGVAQWQRGATMQQVMEQADAAMYLDKQKSGAKRA